MHNIYEIQFGCLLTYFCILPGSWLFFWGLRGLIKHPLYLIFNLEYDQTSRGIFRAAQSPVLYSEEGCGPLHFEKLHLEPSALIEHLLYPRKCWALWTRKPANPVIMHCNELNRQVETHGTNSGSFTFRERTRDSNTAAQWGHPWGGNRRPLGVVRTARIWSQRSSLWAP